MKLWAGRFQKETDTLVNQFNSSIDFDSRLYRQDIEGSIAHASMLGKQGIIEEHEAEKSSRACARFWRRSTATAWSSPWTTRIFT